MNKESFDPETVKITDMRFAVIGTSYDYPIVKIDTNQGVYGIGEVRDGGHKESALMYKGWLLGKNPTHIDELCRLMTPGVARGGGREAGGMSSIEMALWDITGKIYGVPVYQFIGGKYRNKIPIYSGFNLDYPRHYEPTAESYVQNVLNHKKKGSNFIKIDLGNTIRTIPGALLRNRITQKGIDYIVSIVRAVREAVGWETSIAVDHFGPLEVKDCIRVGNALEDFCPEWFEDLRPGYDIEGWKSISQAVKTPTLTGQDIFGVDDFRALIDRRAVDMVHPDIGNAGGIRETKRIADYAEEKSHMRTVLHFAGSPIGLMANLHVAAAIHDLVALEHNFLDLSWWKDLVTGLADPLLKDGYMDVPNKPGLGVDLNPEVIKEHLSFPGYFEPTSEWDYPHMGAVARRSAALSHARLLAATAGAPEELANQIGERMVKENRINMATAYALVEEYKITPR